MPRPTTFNAPLGGQLVARIGAGERCGALLADLGVGKRTLQEWLQRGRAGEAPYHPFALDFDRAAREGKRRRYRARLADGLNARKGAGPVAAIPHRLSAETGKEPESRAPETPGQPSAVAPGPAR